MRRRVRVIRSQRRECECGSWKYGYETKENESSKLYLCFSCGKFEAFGVFTDNMVQAFCEEPRILMHLMKTEFIKPIR
jgi:hypothetical protein|tara:strand:+ start:397 stop:630 length:234 start_codon:yes stop_codon:yes gene_type:complete